MTALTLYYVSPASGNDSTGTGAIGAPWQTTQHALNTIVQGAGGDQINIQAGTDDTLSAALTLATYGTPSATKPLIFRGYTSVANDGGIGGLNGNATVSCLNEGKSNITIKDMHMHNCGAAVIWNSTGGTLFVEHCELDTSTGGGFNSGGGGLMSNSYAHDISGTAIITAPTLFNRIETLTKTPTEAILASTPCAYNTIAIGSNGNSAGSISGIRPNGGGVEIFGNSIWCNNGTGTGINITASNCVVFDNIIEGFSGTGGKGIVDGGFNIPIYGKNKLYNNATQTSFTGVQLISLGADITLSGSPFNSPSAAPADLSLNNTASAGASCRAAAYPGAWPGLSTSSPFTSYRDSGAMQHQDSGGGGTSYIGFFIL